MICAVAKNSAMLRTTTAAVNQWLCSFSFAKRSSKVGGRFRDPARKGSVSRCGRITTASGFTGYRLVVRKQESQKTCFSPVSRPHFKQYKAIHPLILSTAYCTTIFQVRKVVLENILDGKPMYAVERIGDYVNFPQGIAGKDNALRKKGAAMTAGMCPQFLKRFLLPQPGWAQKAFPSHPKTGTQGIKTGASAADPAPNAGLPVWVPVWYG